MPAKDTTLLTGPRDTVLSYLFCKKIAEKVGNTIDKKTVIKIITASNQKIQEIAADEEGGFKMPENMGYLVITKYKSKKKPIDWINTRKLKKKIYLTNLHSFGYIHHIKWFRLGLVFNFSGHNVYKFLPCRTFKRRVAKNVKDHKTYHYWTSADFWSSAKTLKRFINKK